MSGWTFLSLLNVTFEGSEFVFVESSRLDEDKFNDGNSSFGALISTLSEIKKRSSIVIIFLII